MSQKTEIKPESKAPPEEQYIIRFPPETAKQVRKRLKNNSLEKMHMTFPGTANARDGSLSFNGQNFKVTVANLPTVVETHKTTDCKSYYKSGDIGQILVVEETGVPSYDLGKMNANAVLDGLTPAAKSIQKRKFRKVPIVSPEEIKEAQDEILRLQKGGIFREFDVELIPVEIVDEIFETPNMNTIVTLNNGKAPIRAGIPTTWTDAELDLLPQQHKDLAKAEELKREQDLAAEFEKEMSLDGDEDLPEDTDLNEPSNEPPLKKQRTGKGKQKKKTPQQIKDEEEAEQIMAMQAEENPEDAGKIHALRCQKVELTNKITNFNNNNETLLLILENDMTPPSVRARLQAKLDTALEEIRILKLEMTEVERELKKYHAL